MTTTILYDAYGEDGDFNYFNGSVGSNPGYVVDTGGVKYRPSYARCAIGVLSTNSYMTRTWASGPLTQAWTGHRYSVESPTGNVSNVWGLVDIDGNLRIVARSTNSGTSTSNSLVLLGTTTAGFSTNPTTPDQFSVNFNYSTTGFINLYVNSSLIFTYTGDITTNGMTQVAGTYLGNFSGRTDYWSENVLLSTDTRNVSISTTAANGTGTTDNWTGTYTNVNTIPVDDSNFDTTITSGAIQRYTMTSIISGNYNIIGKVTSLRGTQGGGTLTHLQLAELIGGTAYTTSAVNFPTAFGPVTFIQQTNPNTSLPWTLSDINAVGRESGYEATT